MKTITIRINTFNELIRFIESHDLTPQQLQDLVKYALGVYCLNDWPKAELVQRLKKYWKRYSCNVEKPLFLDLED